MKDVAQKLWNSLCNQTNSPQADELLAELFELYCEENRYYHNLMHIVHSLALLEENFADHPDFLAISFAIWYHDAIHNAGADDNEEKSAELAKEHLKRLNFDPDFIVHVQKLIMITSHQEVPQNEAQQIISDIDLAILGSPFRTYQNYYNNIRREYSHLSKVEFRRGRLKFIDYILKRPEIYYTEHFKKKFKTKAFSNLNSEYFTEPSSS